MEMLTSQRRCRQRRPGKIRVKAAKIRGYGRLSDNSLDIYLIAIGGTGMAPLACLLKDLGHHVRGVDGPLYPPMSTLLESAGIEPLEGYEAFHLKAEPRPDLVIVGNAVPKINPEVRQAEELDLPRLSMPQALSRFLLTDRKPLVVSGTHGKTTTTSMAAWVYHRAGQEPGYLVGGIPMNLSQSFRIGSGPRFIVEGDEYNAAYFDRGPKFLHYQPHTLILTSVEYDHADLYPTHETLLEAYRKLVALLPEDGLLVAFGDDDQVREISQGAACKTVFFGLDPENDVSPIDLEGAADGSRFHLEDGEGGRVELCLQVPGEHNLTNALAVWAAARHDGIPAATVAEALGSFAGSKRRLEEIGEVDEVVVVDDFAHHPTAVEKSLQGLRQRYPGRRIVALFEPRSLTAGRSFFHSAYRKSFKGADVVFFAPIFHAGRLGKDDRLNLNRLVDGLRLAGVDAHAYGRIDDLKSEALNEARPGDVLVTMSSGSFEGLAQRLLAALQERKRTDLAP